MGLYIECENCHDDFYVAIDNECGEQFCSTFCEQEYEDTNGISDDWDGLAMEHE